MNASRCRPHGTRPKGAPPPPGAGGRRKLPIGIQTFSEIRTGGYYYVDKTAGLRRLIDAGKHFFLSRPRRFGKSLLVDTLKQLFEGNRPLFEGLAIHDHWDWTVRHPVLRLDFSGGDFTAPDALPAQVADQMAAAERRAGLAGAYASLPGRFAGLIEALHEQSGQRVVVLVDEYDEPILDALEMPDAARANRNLLRGLYGAIKSSDAHVRFTLLTGVSRFSKVSLFSGLNNLIDVTLDPRHGALCGYTDADLDTVFAPELPGLDRDAIRRPIQSRRRVVLVAVWWQRCRRGGQGLCRAAGSAGCVAGRFRAAAELPGVAGTRAAAAGQRSPVGRPPAPAAASV